MATVKIDTFGGIAPRQHPTLLADGMAVTAHNCRLKTGKLVPLRAPRLVEGDNIILAGSLNDVKDAKSMHIWRKNTGDFDFLCFKGNTWVAPGIVADDDFTRIVVSGDTECSYVEREGQSNEKTWSNSPVIYFRRGNASGYEALPLRKDPIGFPVARRKAGAVPEGASDVRYTRFFFTWVDAYQMESPVSPPSRNYAGQGEEPEDEDVQYLNGDVIQFQPITDLPQEAMFVRVYKVIAGTETGRIQFIKEFSRDDVVAEGRLFNISVNDENAGEILPEIEAPPGDLVCIHDVPGAFYCGFSPSMPKTVCFSDVNLLYSWPVAYRYDVADNLVALAVTSNSVFALTEGWPYVISGTAPESMTVAKLAGPAACVSARGVTVYRNAVYFVSNKGLMSIYNSADAGTVCQNLTDKIFTKDQWLAMNPSSCVMGQHDGALFLYFTLADGTHKGLTIDLMDDMKIAVTTHDEAAKCICVDTGADKMYFIRERM